MIVRITVSGTTTEVDRPQFYRGYSVRSLCYVCPWCLATWAVLEAGSAPYHIVQASCAQCPPSYIHPVAGSILEDWTGCGGYDTDLLDVLPLSLLKREFALTLKAHECHQHSQA